MSRRSAVFQDGDIGNPLDFRLASQSNELNERRREFDIASGQRKLEAKAKAASGNLKLVDDIALDDIGDNTVDLLTQKQISGLKNKMMDAHKAGASTEDLMVLRDKDLPAIVAGHTIGKNYLDQIKLGAIEAAKKFGGDPEKLRRLAMADMVKHIVKVDGNNNSTGYNEMIDPQKNFIEKYTSPETMGAWNNPSGKVQEFVEKLKLTPFAKEDVFNNKGFKEKRGYSGNSNFLSRFQTDPKTGDVIGSETAYEEVPFGNEKIKVLPEQQEKEILADPVRAAELYEMVKPSIEALEAETGEPVKHPAKELLMRHKLYEMVDAHKTHSFKENEEKVIPKPASTNINNYIKNGQDVPVIDLWTDVEDRVNKTKIGVNEKGQMVIGTPFNELRSQAQTKILKAINELNEDADYTNSNVFLRRNPADNQIWVVNKKKVPKSGPKGQEIEIPSDAWISPINQEDLNVAGNQELGTPSKKQSVRQGQSGSPKANVKAITPPPKSKYVEIKEVNGVKYGKTSDGKIEKI